MKKKILYPFHGNTVGGSHVSTFYLIQEINKYDVEIELVFDNKLMLDKLNFSNNNKTYLLKLASKSLLNFHIVINFVKIFFHLINSKPSVVHINDLRTAYLWIIPTKILGVPVIFHYRTRWIKSRFSAFLTFLSNKIFVASNFIEKDIPEKFRKKIVKVNNIFSHRKLKKKRREKFNVCFVGSILPQKNLITFCNMAEILIKKNIKFKFLIIGRKTYYFNFLYSLLKKKKILNHFLFSDFKKDINKYFELADILVCPEINDGFGRTIIDGMLNRIPVIASNSGGHKELIKNGVNGFLVETFNHEKYAEKIIKLKRNFKLRQKIINNAFKWGCKVYLEGKSKTVDSIYLEYMKIVR